MMQPGPGKVQRPDVVLRELAEELTLLEAELQRENPREGLRRLRALARALHVWCPSTRVAWMPAQGEYLAGVNPRIAAADGLPLTRLPSSPPGPKKTYQTG